MEEKVNGVVLSSVNYGENDKIVSIFTIEKGVVSASVKGVKKAGAKLKFAAEPFCFSEFVFSVKGDKRTVIGASLNDGFYPIREDIVRLYSASTLLSFIKCFLKSEIVSEKCFVLLIEGLKEICYGEKNPKSVTAGFLISALRLVGYGLNLEGCFYCGQDLLKPHFDYNIGGFYCENCAFHGGREINPLTYGALKKLSEGKEITEEEAVFSLRLLNYYILNKTEENIEPLKELLKL